jgi:hypothetical protein
MYSSHISIVTSSLKKFWRSAGGGMCQVACCAMPLPAKIKNQILVKAGGLIGRNHIKIVLYFVLA